MKQEMKRTIIKIDEELCNGCGECVTGCHEGALQIIDGKAKLVNEVFCDGLGACIGDCPTGALTLEEREAEAFDEAAVEAHVSGKKKAPEVHFAPIHQGCPGSMARSFEKPAGTSMVSGSSELQQWPVQLHLLSPSAPYLRGSDLLLAADCTAFSVGDFHSKYLKGKKLAIACPKLDQGREIYINKLISMIDDNYLNTLTVMIMEVPCCSGLLQIAKEATASAIRKVPVKLIQVSVQGHVLREEWI